MTKKKATYYAINDFLAGADQKGVERSHQQVADMLKLSVKTIYSWKDQGRQLYIERRGTPRRYKYQLVELKSVNPVVMEPWAA